MKNTCSYVIGLAVVLGLYPSRLSAETVRVDVCAYVIRTFLVPATYQDATRCIDCGGSFAAGLHCVANPVCAAPVACLASPDCVLHDLIVTVAEHYEEGLVWKCEPQDLDPAVEFQKWLEGQIAALPDLLLPGAGRAAEAEINTMKLSAAAIPANVRSQLMALIGQSSVGPAKWDATDRDSARLLSNSNAMARPYLREGFGAITLGDLVIMRDTHFQRLTDPTRNFTLAQYSAGGVPADYADSILTLIHELVHVRQYKDRGGFQAFVTSYGLESTIHEYSDISKEREAVAYEMAVAQTIPGMQSVEVRAAAARMAGAVRSTASPLSRQQIEADRVKFVTSYFKCAQLPPGDCWRRVAPMFNLDPVPANGVRRYEAIYQKIGTSKVVKIILPSARELARHGTRVPAPSAAALKTLELAPAYRPMKKN